MAERKPETNNDPKTKYRNESSVKAVSAKATSVKAAPSKAASVKATTAKAADKKSDRRPGCLNTCLALVATIFCACLALAIYSQSSDVKAARRERALLLEIAESLELNKTRPDLGLAHSETEMPLPEEPGVQYISAFDIEMREINPDYLCWIKIDDTEIDYPVVRGLDNEKYLDTSFYGEKNGLGTLFMDYRCVGDSVPHIIIFGHNSRHGDMFGSLRNFLDERYLAEHPVITLKANDRITEYEIFSARRTNVNDPAYFIDFSEPGAFRVFAERCGAPPGSAQIITLSTCVSGNDKDERVVIQGTLRIKN